MNLEKFGRYKIKHKLKRGGMATVYLAHDPRFGRDVALKVMSPMFSDDQTFRGRFIREAKTIAALEHSAIVPVYDFGEEGELLYLVMRYMAGGSLSERIALSGAFSLQAAMAVLRPIAQALDHAHDSGVVHRDLKPGNILFDDYGHAFLSDFGIVKLSESTATLTKSGVIGTPAYMSPEQVHGDGPIDGRSDIYTLGIILYEMLTGRKPYHADTPAKLMMSHVLNPIPDILAVRPELPHQCDTIIQRTLAKKADARYAHATEMAEALNDVVTGSYQTPKELKQRPFAPPENSPPPVLDTATISLPSDDETATASLVTPDEATISLQAPTVQTETVVSPANTPIATATPVIQKEKSPTKVSWGRWAGIITLIVVLTTSCTWGYPTLTAYLGITGDLEPTPLIPPAPTLMTTPETMVTTPIIEPTLTTIPTAIPTATPETISINFATTDLGTPLTLTRIGFGEQVVLLVGGLHAGFAPASVTVAEQMIEHYQANPQAVPTNISLYILPNLNPDSAPAQGQLAGRLNSNEVDLNRNWDCRWSADPLWGGAPLTGAGGPFPFSEAEIVALRDFIEAQSPELVLFWGAQSANGLVSAGACEEETAVSRDLAIVYGEASGYTIGDFETITSQSLTGDATNWLDSQGIPAMTILLPAYNNPDFDTNLTAVEAVLTTITSEN